MDMNELRALVTKISKKPRTDDIEILLTYIEKLHNQYAFAGGKPEIMTAEALKSWFRMIFPLLTDVRQTKTPNVFYVSFASLLKPEQEAYIKSLGFEVRKSPAKLRWKLKWQSPGKDEV